MNLTKILRETYENVPGETILPIKVAGKDVLGNITEVYEQFLNPDERKKIYDNTHHSNSIYHPLVASTVLLNQVFQKSPWETQDIDTFLFSLLAFQNEKSFYLTGAFISALVNIHHKHTNQKDYILPLEQLDKPLDYICSKNDGANILVKGNCGEAFASDMISGNVICEGSVGANIGMKLKSGIILIKKDAVGWIGRDMIDGCITIKGRIHGHTEEDIKPISSDSFYEIHVENSFGGEIYHGSRRVFPK